MSKDRRLDILRAIARNPVGLRIYQIECGLSKSIVGDYVRELHKDGHVDAVPVRRYPTFSSKPVVRYVINDSGRKLLDGAQ